MISAIKDITDSKLLHMIAANYNWDDGIEIPKSIIANQYCDLATALMVFDLAEGYELLLGDEENIFSKSDRIFLSSLQERIDNNLFSSKSIKYIPDLTKVQKYRIKKNCPNINRVFLDGTSGDFIEIIQI